MGERGRGGCFLPLGRYVRKFPYRLTYVTYIRNPITASPPGPATIPPREYVDWREGGGTMHRKKKRGGATGGGFNEGSLGSIPPPIPIPIPIPPSKKEQK